MVRKMARLSATVTLTATASLDMPSVNMARWLRAPASRDRGVASQAERSRCRAECEESKCAGATASSTNTRGAATVRSEDDCLRSHQTTKCPPSLDID
jgi:hypothetical protein